MAEDRTWVAVFDGACGLCRAFVRWAQARVGGQPIRWLAYQDAEFAALPVSVTLAEAARSFVWIGPEGKKYTGARAVFQLFRHLRWPWRLAGWLLANPLAAVLAEPFYRLVARYRRRISAWLGLSACVVPPAKAEDGFPDR